MADIHEFKQRERPAPTQGGGVPSCVATHKVPVVSPDIAITCAADVIQALAFYAKQGFDGGEQARRALRGMQLVVQQRSEEEGP